LVGWDAARLGADGLASYLLPCTKELVDELPKPVGSGEFGGLLVGLRGMS
jgi:hypothetical protein